MNNTLTKFLLGGALTFGFGTGFSQNNCPNLGPDQYLPCGQTTAALVANFSACNPSTVQAKQTNTYGVVNIPFAPQPTVGATSVVMSDDSGTGALPIGFTFCFFGNTYTQFYIGSNGWISFSAGQSTGFVSAAIPNTGFVPKNCIMGPWQDWHPGIAGGPYICYQTLGTAPCRRLVVSWRSCPMYSCTNLKGTFQIIIYETTNLIENHITNKPNCPSWAGGTAVEGIHNLAGTIGITVPGRNSTQWTATNNAWRWFPNGATVTPTLNWYVVGNPTPFAQGPSVTVTPAVTGNSYTCKQDYGPCNQGFEICSAMPGNGPDTVFVMPQSAIIPTITAPICIGGPTQIWCAPASATNNYVWSGPFIQGPNNTPTITVAGPGTYTCAITSTNAACAGTAQVTIFQTPTVTIASSSPTMCMFNTNNSLNSVSLTAAGAPSYTWSNIVGLVNTFTSTTQPQISFMPAPPAIIGSVLLTGASGPCTNTATYSVLIIPNPTVTVSSPSVCAGGTVAIIANNASSYTWTPTSLLNPPVTGSMVVANTPTTQVYTVTGSSLGCNSATENSTVTVVANPTVMVTPLTNTICFGQSLALTASGATNYTWSPSGSLSNPNGSNVVASPSVTTNYIVIGEAATCTASAMYQVSVIILPSIVSTPPTFTICQYSTINIYANGASSYSWSPGSGLNTVNGGQVTASPNVTTIYNITGNNGACNAFGQVTVYVVPFPNLNVSTPNGKICEGQSTNIFSSGAMQYTIQPSTGLSSTTSAMAIANPISPTNYTIAGINTGYGINCISRKEILIDVLPTINPEVSPNATICLGQSTKLLADGASTFSWSPGASLNNGISNNPVASPTVTTIYTVNISHFNNCTVTQTVQVRVNPTPTVYAGEDFVVNLDEPMYLNGQGSGTITWVQGEEVFCPPCPNSQIFPKQSGIYKIRTVNEFGCIAEDEVHVEVTTNFNIYIPNIFTPNEDGLNDVFIVYGTGLTKFEMTVFDRWGEKLFVSKDQLIGWDGSFKGKLSKNDVYPYLIQYTSLDGKKHTKSGHVTLLK
jgi:gliding motility-associated-like protein